MEVRKMDLIEAVANSLGVGLAVVHYRNDEGQNQGSGDD